LGTFEAGVQYKDFKGTAAADRADQLSFRDYLKGGLCSADEIVVGIRIGFAENYGRAKDVRAVEVDITTAKLFSFFKCFDMVMTAKGLDLSQAVVNGPLYD
jgi:hypothetical protein